MDEKNEHKKMKWNYYKLKMQEGWKFNKIHLHDFLFLIENIRILPI